VADGELIQRAADGEAAALEDVGVDHGGLYIFVAEEFLDRPDVIADFKQVSGKRVSERMTPEENLHFVFGKDNRQRRGLLGAHQVNALINLLLQDVAVKKENGRESLSLGGGGDLAIDGQVGQEGRDFGRAHIFGMAELVEVDRAFDPIYVSFFGTDGIMFDTDSGAELVEEFWGLGSHRLAFLNTV